MRRRKIDSGVKPIRRATAGSGNLPNEASSAAVQLWLTPVGPMFTNVIKLASRDQRAYGLLPSQLHRVAATRGQIGTRVPHVLAAMSGSDSSWPRVRQKSFVHWKLTNII